jgi:hypothetical protein
MIVFFVGHCNFSALGRLHQGEMRLRLRRWLTKRVDWKQLAPENAYLSCEYLP